jgi:hypothetical protein
MIVVFILRMQRLHPRVIQNFNARLCWHFETRRQQTVINDETNSEGKNGKQSMIKVIARGKRESNQI